MALNPYVKEQRTAGLSTPGQTEGWALVECARRLDQFCKAEKIDVEAFINQLRTNWNIWTIIQSEASDPNSALPREVRQNLLNLAGFIDQKTIELLQTRDVKAVNILININRQVGAGFMECNKQTETVNKNANHNPQKGSSESITTHTQNVDQPSQTVQSPNYRTQNYSKISKLQSQAQKLNLLKK
ncbi:MAG: flagellar biosynthesis regulator FlaF [Pseudomonadota bacterium]